jgi:phospholipase A-2-activating protein
MVKPYKLALTLHGHSADVRNLSVPDARAPLLVSASRDGSAIVWTPGAGNGWNARLRVEALEREFVNCATAVTVDGQGEFRRCGD